jgi:amino acid adenylation domain-containing protein
MTHYFPSCRFPLLNTSNTHEKGLAVTQKSSIQPVRRSSAGSPLSWFQERLWLLNQKNSQDTSYNIPVAFLIEGVLDVPALGRSLTAILRRHENLRARFTATPGHSPVQLASDPEELVLGVVDATPEEIAGHVLENANHRFNLARGPVVISSLLRLSPEKHLLLLNVHHIVADGWSIEGILFSELHKCYEAFCEGKQPNLPELPIQYSDFAIWQRKQDISGHLAYWRDSLQGYDGSLELPTDYLRRPNSGERSASFIHRYGSEFSLELDRFSQKHNVTMFMSLLASLALLAERYTGKKDLCIGTTTSGRPLPELEGLIGFFINILPLRIQVNEGWTVRDYMAEVRKLTVAAFDHQAVPFERILQSLGIAQSGRGSELVPLVVRHQNFPHTRMNKDLPGGVRFSPYVQSSMDDSSRRKTSQARCEVELSYTGNRDGLEVEAVYAADLYRKSTVTRILAHHEHLLRAMFEDESRIVGQLPMLSRDEVQRICADSNWSLSASTGLATFVERFDLQVQRTPEKTACIDRSGPSNYRSLAARTNRLAHALAARGSGAGDVVGVCLERGGPLLASFLAVWKTGAAYVPLDPSYPESYLGQILADAAPKLVIGTSATLSKLSLDASMGFALDLEADALASFPDSPPQAPGKPKALAYIMYTSGSTGVPKGVRVPHRQLVNWLSGIEANWPFEAGDVVGQKTTIAFAPSVKELFAGLLNGSPQVFIDGPVVQDTPAFVATLAQHRVTRLNLVPSHLEGVLRYLEKEQTTLPALRMCITAGEPLSAELVASFRVLLPQARLINNYGCTELNDITYYDTSEFDGNEGFVPVGKPIQHTRIYVLDHDKRLVPEGVPGELHVATVGVLEGYHHLPELNATQFLANPFKDNVGDRLFNTGDVVRRLPDGNIEFMGRLDFQVKVRGQRVDVRHVEKVLGEFPGIGLRAVVSDGSQLSAYYVANEAQNEAQPVDIGSLRKFMQTRLPGYMVPAAFISVQAMPRLPNGKLDRRALRPALGQLQQSGAYEAPTTEGERALAAIWSQVLELSNEEIGKNSHFFEIGGDSLAAARVVAHIKEKLGVEIGMSQVFEFPRLAELGDCVSAARQGGGNLAEGVDNDSPFVAGEVGARGGKGSGLLEGKIVLITGGSRGIGSSSARLLASHGAKVAINYLKNEARAARVKELIEADGGIAELFQADVTDREQTTRMVERVRAKFGKIDILVSNAAIGFKMRSFLEHDWVDFQRKLNDEIGSMFHLCRAVVPDMIEHGGGSIVAVSSSMSRSWGNGFVAHSTAKAALDSFVRSLACELGPEGIRVNTVAPGLILTDATANLSPHIKDAASARCPLRRNGLPRDVAGAVLFLASELSQFMTGGYFAVDGGFTM